MHVSFRKSTMFAKVLTKNDFILNSLAVIKVMTDQSPKNVQVTHSRVRKQEQGRYRDLEPTLEGQ